MSRIIKFEQNSCVPCQKLKNFLEYDLGVQPDKTFNPSTGDETSLNAAAYFGIMSSPVLILVDDKDNEIERIVGFDGKQERISEMFTKRG